MDYENFAHRLKQLREDKGITQAQLGELIGVSKAVVSKYETAASFPTLQKLVRIAGVYRVSTDFLLEVKTGKTIDVSKLTDSQISSISKLVDEFEKSNGANNEIK